MRQVPWIWGPASDHPKMMTALKDAGYDVIFNEEQEMRKLPGWNEAFVDAEFAPKHPLRADYDDFRRNIKLLAERAIGQEVVVVSRRPPPDKMRGFLLWQGMPVLASHLKHLFGAKKFYDAVRLLHDLLHLCEHTMPQSEVGGPSEAINYLSDLNVPKGKQR